MQALVPPMLHRRGYPCVDARVVETKDKLPEAKRLRIKTESFTTKYPASEVVVRDVFSKIPNAFSIPVREHASDDVVKVLLPRQRLEVRIPEKPPQSGREGRAFVRRHSHLFRQ